MNCPLCGRSCTQPGWWCNLFLAEFPKAKLDTGELAYHLKTVHGSMFLCPCGQEIIESADERVLKERLQILCLHYESLTDLDIHIQFHTLARKNVHVHDL